MTAALAGAAAVFIHNAHQPFIRQERYLPGFFTFLGQDLKPPAKGDGAIYSNNKKNSQSF
jgi:hypothetical protein